VLSWGIKRIGLTASVLLGASAAALLLWQNVSKRLGIEDNAAALVQSHPNYAPALLRLNDTVLNQYASVENRQKIAEGSLEFSDSEANVIKSRAKRAFANAPLNVKAITQIAMADFLRTLTWTDRDMLLLAKSRNARDRQTLNWRRILAGARITFALQFRHGACRTLKITASRFSFF